MLIFREAYFDLRLIEWLSIVPKSNKYNYENNIHFKSPAWRDKRKLPAKPTCEQHADSRTSFPGYSPTPPLQVWRIFFTKQSTTKKYNLSAYTESYGYCFFNLKPKKRNLKGKNCNFEHLNCNLKHLNCNFEHLNCHHEDINWNLKYLNFNFKRINWNLKMKKCNLKPKK